jgi:hypothetical protein
MSFVAIAGVGFIAPIANADSEPGGVPDFKMTFDASNDEVGPDTYNPNDKATTQVHWDTVQMNGKSYTGWRYIGGFETLHFKLSWDCLVNEDPFVVATINVTNTGGGPANFDTYMSLPIFPAILGATQMDGSVAAVLTNNSPFTTGASLLSTADPIYQAFIDPAVNPPAGSSARTLWGGYSLGVVSGFPNSASDSDIFGPELGPAALSSIALRLIFNLSAGDQASVSGVFQVTEVPGPAGLAVFAAFGAIIGGRRRRN